MVRVEMIDATHPIAGNSRARAAAASDDTTEQITMLPNKYLPESCRA